MATFRNIACAAWVVALIAGGAGCYKPNIQDGGLRCAFGGTDGGGGACPEGFHCAANGTCKQGPPPKCAASSPHVAPLCTPTLGAECDPVCQGGCDCGRCTLVGTMLKCVAPGTKKRGEFCTPGSDTDDCEPGNVCMFDCDPKVARCVRFCGRNGVTDDSLCDMGQICNVPVTDVDGGVTDLLGCPPPGNPPGKMCNPVGDTIDCGNAALGCYFDDTIASTVCDCRGTSGPGGRCSVLNSCVAGYRCITMGNSSTCMQTCKRTGTDCPTGSTCQSAGGGDFGFCMP